MSAGAEIELDWADGHYRFRLPIGQLRELQDKTGTGPFALFQRLLGGGWMVDDLREIIRLGLIGGGAEPLVALSLVKRYVEERPLIESVTPARLVMGAALFGDPEDTVGKNLPEESQQSGSTSPDATPSEPSWGSHPKQ